MRCLILRFLKAALFLTCMCGLANATTIFQQVPGVNSFDGYISSTLNILGGSPGFRTADGFLIAGGGTIRTVEWWGKLGSGGQAFNITFYHGGAVPGAVLSTNDVSPVSSSISTGSPMDPVTFYSATLGTPFVAVPGIQYWMSIFDGAVDANWIWLSANADTNGAKYAQNGTVTWNNTSGDRAFQLRDDVIPEPATFLLLGTGLGVIGLAAWRKRK
jgi:hypothetical protein